MVFRKLAKMQLALCSLLLLASTSGAAQADSGYIGVLVQEMQSDMAKAIGLNETGALVRDIAFDGPGIEAGLRRGDLIVKVGNKAIKSVDQLVGIFQNIKVGDVIELGGYRDRKAQSWTIKAGPWPEARKVKKGAFASLPAAGITVAAITTKIRDRFNLRWQSTGLLVTLVSPEFAGRTALQRGDVILQVNQQPVWKPDQMLKIFSQAKKDGKPFLLLLVESPSGFVFQKLPIN